MSVPLRPTCGRLVFPPPKLECGSGRVFLSESDRVAELKPYPVSLCFLCPKPSFKPEHWAWVMKLLFLWLQNVEPGYICVCHVEQKSQELNRIENIIYFNIFSESLGWSDRAYQISPNLGWCVGIDHWLSWDLFEPGATCPLLAGTIRHTVGWVSTLYPKKYQIRHFQWFD